MSYLTRAARGGLHRLLSALALCALLAVPAGAAQRSLRFEHLSIEDGLSQQSALTILQDRQGFMWFGTQAGLNRFDGYRMTVYRNDPNDPASLPDNFVSASYEDAGGRLWFGTKGGLARFDPASARFERYVPLDAEAGRSGHRAVYAITAAPGGALWLATSDGLLHFDPATRRFRAYRHDPDDPASLRDNRVTALAVDGQGQLWVGTEGGLDRLDPRSGRFSHHAVEPALDAQRNTVLSLSMGPRDTLWIGTAAGLEAWRLDAGGGSPQRRHLGLAEGMPDVRIISLYHDSGAQLWVGTDTEGLKWRDPASGRFDSWTHAENDQHSLSDNQVPAVLVDRTGTLWVGTYYGGVNRTDLASGGFTRYGDGQGLGRSRVRAIMDDGAGGLWLGTTGNGLLRLDRASGRLRQYAGPRLPSEVVTSLARARGRLWIGTPMGLVWRNDQGRIGRVALGPGPAANYVNAIREGRDGTLWVITRGGLSALPPGSDVSRSWRHDPDDPTSLGDNYGFAVLEDRQGIVWIGTETGLERFDRQAGTFTRFRHDPQDPHSLRHSRVYYLKESSRGELWIGTAGGLHRMETGGARPRFRFFPFAQGQEALPVGAVLEDAGGVLWVSTTAGITRLDPVSGQIKNYTSKDGLIDGSFFVGAGWRSADGQLHFGGINGMTSFRPEAVRDNPFPPVPVITDLLVLNRSRAASLGDMREGKREITLSHRDSVFALEFAALHFADPQGNRYAYQLEGFDQNWVDTDARRRFATYTNLDPGSYVFRVRASNKDGLWSQEAATLAITITPPFWKTWWFRTLAVAIVLALSYLLYRLRVRVLVRQKGLLEREVGVRTAELLLQKEAAERRKREVERQKEVVERAHRDIALLSDIGRLLTANLDSEAIMRTLYEHVQALMDTRSFAVALRQPERGTIGFPFAVVDGRRVPAFEIADDPRRHLVAWSMAGGREILVGDLAAELPAVLGQDGGADQPLLESLTQALMETNREKPGSLLCVPVSVGERVVGAVTVQSPTLHAYGQVHLDMLETLAAYVGVAIDNAQAYHQLKQTQAQLASHEKLASLGSLVAGVAHELNTPIGNSLLMASTLQEKTLAVATRFDQAQLKRSDLADYMAASTEASDLIVRSLHNAAELVSSFRQVSVDQASAQRRRFDLAQACHEIAATMMNTVRLAGHSLVVEVPSGIMMDGFPGPLGQAIINFVNNAMLHAFDAPGGRMRLSAEAGEGTVRIVFRDDGRGVAQEHLARIFDPFFTTRMGQGGTGLGLNIVYNIVTSLLGGTIRVESELGQGTAFVLDLPLRAPDARVAEDAAQA
ncbi:two-component regulator propeller domain-containing protein [Massilia sp. ST3]|uniref:two-component regulator propeller domain-containing protein n=1 Tax=Massilia sp. ST3 TaxID=2824903 RepID=UPI001B836571|nr:two-component regulator propeller domain-containing protein [Massilia sp. ST3]MBQ5947052.1 GAF domain-containing protein [Massilia sp. ST3]